MTTSLANGAALAGSAQRAYKAGTNGAYIYNTRTGIPVRGPLSYEAAKVELEREWGGLLGAYNITQVFGSEGTQKP